VPALIVAGFLEEIRVVPWVFAVTLAHTLILGLPVALTCRARRWTRFRTAIAGGFLIGSAPIGLLAGLAGLAQLGSDRTESVGGVPTIVNGVPTLAGGLQYFQLFGAWGCLGSAGALVFWSALRWFGAFAIAGPDFDRPPGRWLGRARYGIPFAGSAVIASVAVAAIPSITMDRTCHNMFKDGRTTISPSVNIDLDVAPADWPTLTRVLEQFGTAHAMSFRNTSTNRPGVVEVLSLSLCTDAGLNIDVIEQRWASQKFASPMPGWGVPIGVYELNNGTLWEAMGRDLVTALDSQWPGKVRFRDADGRLVGRPALLASQYGTVPAR